MKRVFLAVAIIAAALTVTVASAQADDLPRAPAPHDSPRGLLEVKIQREVLYDTHDNQELYLDVAMPKEGGPYPCLVIFHGGAWIAGSRKDLSYGEKLKDGTYTTSAIERLAARGYVVVAPSYRLAPKFQFPAQIQDA